MRTLLKWHSHSSYLLEGVTLNRVHHRELVSSDDLLAGWGAVFRGMAASGLWSSTWSGSVLELRTVRLSPLPFLEGNFVFFYLTFIN